MPTKRFIAGAVCPRCGEMDRLVVYEKDDGTYKECVSCGFEEQQIAQVEMKELDTRVNSQEDIVQSVEPIKMMLGTPASDKSE